MSVDEKKRSSRRRHGMGHRKMPSAGRVAEMAEYYGAMPVWPIVSDNDELNKTLPANFKYRHKQGMHLGSPTTMAPQARSAGQTKPRRIQRWPPLAPHQKPDLERYKRNNLGQSDPSLARNLLSPEDSFEDDSILDPICKRDGLRLPMRAQSFNYPRSPNSTRIPSPCPGDAPSLGMSLSFSGATTTTRTWSPCVNSTNFERFSAGRRSEMTPSRRWSVVSLASSGYTTGATDSPQSLSSYPSQEHIHQLPTTPTWDDFHLLSRHLRSDSSSSVVGTDEDGTPVVDVRRARARSLSPERSPREILMDLDATHNIFRNKYPAAKEVMEERLTDFLTKNSEENLQLSDSTMNFARHQILSYAREILEKSKDGMLSKDQFIILSDNLEATLAEVAERTTMDTEELRFLVKRLLIIIGRVARLIEIMQFDPLDFSATLLDVSEEMGKQQVLGMMSSSHAPYILNRISASLAVDDDESSSKPRRHSRSSSDLHKTSSTEVQERQAKKADFGIIKLISNGAYGAVYLVRHKDSRRRFAMKKVSKHRMVMKQQVQQVFFERDILTFADNPFVVGLWCTFQTKNHLYMVMEYVEGGDMATLIKNVGCLTMEMARMYFSETVLAIEYIHSYGIIHRDLKPDNLLITSEGHIKLTDFGLSKIGLVNYTAHVIEDAWTREKQFHDPEVYGTPDYIAPEVILGQGYGMPVDWWAMGVILYEMMIGATPFWSTTVDELFDEITNANLVINWPEVEEDDISPEAKNIVTSLLCHDPTYRLGSSAVGGVDGVKYHSFFENMDWTSLLKQKAEFIPQLQGEEDTSYFDSRSDRYSHELGSDEEDGDDEAFQQPFESFNYTTPRFSRMLDELPTGGVVKKLVLEPKHEKRDSGIAGLEDPLKVDDPVKILEDYKSEPELLSPSDAETSISSGVPADLEEEEEEEDEDENVVTTIDEVSDEEEVLPLRACTAVPGRILRPAPPPPAHADRRRDHREDDVRRKKPNTLSPLALTTDANHHRHDRHDRPVSPLSPSSYARRKLGRIEDISKLSLQTDRVANITVSPPTPGIHDGGSGPIDVSPLSSPRNSMTVTPVTIKRGPKGFGMILKAIRVYIGDSNDFRLHHIISSVEKKGTAWEAGVRPGYLVTHINGESITGLQQVQVMTIMLDKRHTSITVHTIPLEDTSIQRDKRKRAHSLGHRVGKLLRHGSSGSRKVMKRPSFFDRFRSGRDKGGRGFDGSGHSSSGTPSPKLPSSPHRSDSIKDRMARFSKKMKSSPRRKHTPVSPLARSTSPVALSQMLTPNSSPPGSIQNLSSGTPPSSPPTQTRHRPERHSMIVDSQLVMHKKSHSACELTPPLGRNKGSPQTSPLLKRAVSPTSERKHRPQRSTTLPRSAGKQSSLVQARHESEDGNTTTTTSYL